MWSEFLSALVGVCGAYVVDADLVAFKDRRAAEAGLVQFSKMAQIPQLRAVLAAALFSVQPLTNALQQARPRPLPIPVHTHCPAHLQRHSGLLSRYGA